jgi:hypothetical protein
MVYCASAVHPRSSSGASACAGACTCCAFCILSGVLVQLSGGEIDEAGLSAEQRQHEAGPTFAHKDIGDGGDTSTHACSSRGAGAHAPVLF